MDERLEFEENFNGKLNCRCFTTIRLHHPVRNAIGAVKQIYLKGIWKGNAKILQASTITLDRINLPMAKLDSGLMPEECRRLIRNLYRNRPRHQLGGTTVGLPSFGVYQRIKRT